MIAAGCPGEFNFSLIKGEREGKKELKIERRSMGRREEGKRKERGR